MSPSRRNSTGSSSPIGEWPGTALGLFRLNFALWVARPGVSAPRGALSTPLRSPWGLWLVDLRATNCQGLGASGVAGIQFGIIPKLFSFLRWLCASKASTPPTKRNLDSIGLNSTTQYGRNETRDLAGVGTAQNTFLRRWPGGHLN